MTRRTTTVVVLATVLSGLSSAWAFIVTDPATTARNAVTAVLKNQLLETLLQERERLRQMASRLSLHTNLGKYSLPDPPAWGTSPSAALLYAQSFRDALTVGDADGTAYLGISHEVTAGDDAIGRLSPDAREAVRSQMATLNLADATVIAGTHQTGQVRSNGRRHELPAIEALEGQVIDPSQEQSATAVLDKISGAALIETRQQQARLQLLTAITEQLLVDSKRSRDTEAAALNMQIGRLRHVDNEGREGLLAGAADALRTWRQP